MRLQISMNEPVTLFEANGATARYGLAAGAPDAETLSESAQLILKATQMRLAEDPSEVARMMQYGRPSGDPRYIRALAKFLTENYGDPVDERTLVATAGASSGLFYTLAQLFPNKCKVFCDELSYMIALEMMHQLNFTTVPVPIENDGMNVCELEREFEKHLSSATEAGDMYKAVLYLVPVFHNPTGTVLSREKCKKIVLLARKYNVLVICDDVYNLLWYTNDAHPPRRLFAYDSPRDADYKGNVISNGSFSKLLGPGLRIGWMEMPVHLLQKIWEKSAALDSGGCLNMYMSAIVAKGLEENLLQPFVCQLRKELSERMQMVLRILEDKLPPKCTFLSPEGGYFVWITLPVGTDTKAVLKEAVGRHDLKFQLGSRLDSSCEFESAEEGDISRQFTQEIERTLTKIHGMAPANTVRSDYF